MLWSNIKYQTLAFSTLPIPRYRLLAVRLCVRAQGMCLVDRNILNISHITEVASMTMELTARRCSRISEPHNHIPKWASSAPTLTLCHTRWLFVSWRHLARLKISTKLVPYRYKSELHDCTSLEESRKLPGTSARMKYRCSSNAEEQSPKAKVELRFTVESNLVRLFRRTSGSTRETFVCCS